MAKLQAISGSTTVTLMDTTTMTNTYRLRGVTGMAGAPLRRLTAQGPAQQGDTDLGYRLNPREVELTIGFFAATDAILDGYRDTLVGVFKPLTSTPVILKYTRDDAAIRQIDCYTVGEIDIQLIPEHRVGHYHEATVRVYVPETAWYDPTPGTATVTGTGGTAADWYLAGGAIGTASVLMSGGTPTQGQAWSYAGSISSSTSYTLAFRSTKQALGTVSKYAFYVNNNNLAVGGETDITFVAGTIDPDPNSSNYYSDTTVDGVPIGELGASWMVAGTGNYFIQHNPSGVQYGDFTTPYSDMYFSGIVANRVPGIAAPIARPIGGATRRWRSDAANSVASRWAGTILLYALYSPGLTYNQMAALDAFMTGGVGGTLSTQVAVPYSGDLDEYPVISLRGPIASPVIYNVATDESLDFGTINISAGVTYVINTRPGYKTVLQGTISKRGDLTAASDLGTWHISPDADNGVNVISLYGLNTSGSTQLSIVYYNRYQSF